MKIFVLILGLVFFAGAEVGWAAAKADPFPSSQSSIQSIHIMRLSDGKTLYSKNEESLLIPASVTKLFTAGALLSKFKPNHTFKTRLYYTGPRENEKVKGDLVIVGDGDPLFTSEVLWQVSSDIEHLGVREFSGDLIVDNSLFDKMDRDSSRKEGEQESEHAYDSPITAFGVNFNAIALAIGPNLKERMPAFVNVDPYPIRGIQVQNEIETVSEKERKSAAVNAFRKTLTSKKEVLVATGEIPVHSPLKKIYRSITNAELTAGEYVRAFFESRDILIKGQVKEGKLPKDAKLLLEVPSYELRRLVAGLNVYSNNYIADVLFKRLGAKFPKGGEVDAPGQGTFANGIYAMTQFIKKDVGISTPFTLKNGSGLDPSNRVSAKQITSLLSYMEKRFDVFPEFLASLPAFGWDGTLKDRFSEKEAEPYRGYVRAKTGTLSEPVAVACLAGYFRHPKHGLVAFSILENGKSGKGQPSIYDLKFKQDRGLVAVIKSL